jgi:transcription elongation GreA/GreB family factor
VSRAFVKETDDVPEVLADRMISAHPNFVTKEGLALIERQLKAAGVEQEAARAAGDPSALARATRELRYWTSRRGSAQLVPKPATIDEVRFGNTVTIQRADGRTQIFKLVGEDEADPSRNLLSYVSPLARALIGKNVGSLVRIGTEHAEIKKIE